MKILLSIFLMVVFTDRGNTQSKRIPTSKILTLQIKGMRCLDSGLSVSNTCPLGQELLKVHFYFAFVNKTKKEIRLIGRVQRMNDIESPGLTGIEIFKASYMGNKLIGYIPLGETTDGKKFIRNDGFFDITMEIKENESLFFYRFRYCLEEFRVSKLMK